MANVLVLVRTHTDEPTAQVQLGKASQPPQLWWPIQSSLLQLYEVSSDTAAELEMHWFLAADQPQNTEPFIQSCTLLNISQSPITSLNMSPSIRPLKPPNTSIELLATSNTDE